jgi:hypothetical protein
MTEDNTLFVGEGYVEHVSEFCDTYRGQELPRKEVWTSFFIDGCGSFRLKGNYGVGIKVRLVIERIE